MGLRGPLPTLAHLRAVRNARRRPAPGLTPAIERQLLARADELQRIGLKLLKRAELKPTLKTRSNGEQANPLFGQSQKLFDAADRIHMRLGRLKPEAEDETKSADADPLEAFRRAKH